MHLSRQRNAPDNEGRPSLIFQNSELALALHIQSYPHSPILRVLMELPTVKYLYKPFFSQFCKICCSLQRSNIIILVED